ncbi:hypothetical protein Cgig2_013520 [Carnegiea gigantea]|uniref:Uncharacterized protein n=1 Tax=Carnegiea gigantea TaxID=171969 RepID=A0A9Q1GQ98_9CARY|nr:hypothetical protein Cgig2_013520 [Carnegiea gigantea]
MWRGRGEPPKGSKQSHTPPELPVKEREDPEFEVETYLSEHGVSNWYTDAISVEKEDSVVAYNLGGCYWGRVVCTIEKRKCRRRVEKEATLVSSSTSSSSASDDDGSAFEVAGEAMGNLSSNTSLSLEPEKSGSSEEVEMPKLQSKQAHDKGGSRSCHVRRPKKRGDGACDRITVEESARQTPRRCSLKSDNVQGKGNQQEKLAIEGTMWGPVLTYKPFVMDRHLVWALVESWVPKMKSFRIGRRKVPFSVYDVTSLTGLPATGRHVTFEEGQGTCEVEEVMKAAINDHLARERARRWTDRPDMRMYRNYISIIVDLCKENNTLERLGLFTKLYALLVMSGLLFP